MNESQPRILVASIIAPMILAGMLHVATREKIGHLTPPTMTHVAQVQSAPMPDIENVRVQRTIRLTVTAYSSTMEQTDNDPFTTASGEKVRDGIIAHNGLPFGTRVRFPDAFGDRVFIVADRLNARKGYYIADVWMSTREDAKQWGAPILKMEILES